MSTYDMSLTAISKQQVTNRNPAEFR